jgi:hypothetical protein
MYKLRPVWHFLDWLAPHVLTAVLMSFIIVYIVLKIVLPFIAVQVVTSQHNGELYPDVHQLDLWT